MKLKIKNFNWYAGKPVVFLNEETSKKMNVFVDDRIYMRKNNKKIYAIVDIFSGIVKENQIGISKEEWLSMPERAKVIIRQSLEINHIDHNPTNNKLSNLEWVTKVENSQAYKDSDKYAEYVKETYGVSTILEKRKNI